MSSVPRSEAPAGFVPQVALCFTAPDGSALAIAPGQPLPVMSWLKPALSTGLDGTASGSTVAGPFAPDLGRPIWLTLTGEWSGTVTVQRSTDGGSTRASLTAGGQPWASFTANTQEPVAEESVDGALYYLEVTLTAGTLSFRMEQ